MMKAIKAATPRMTGAARRAAIIKAVRQVFADEGFHGTTTRRLAEAAGVSEALLYQHFPNKEALYSAMLLTCSREENVHAAERLEALEPSTSTLVAIVHLLIARFIAGAACGAEDERIQVRLMQRSLAEDGEFARLIHQRIASHWVPKVEECLKAAVAAGDAVEGPLRADFSACLTRDLATILMLHLLPKTPIVDYGMSAEELAEQVGWFVLRGMGLKDDAIKRYYNPQAFALMPA